MQIFFCRGYPLGIFRKNFSEYFDIYLNDFIIDVEQVVFQLEKIQFLSLMDYDYWKESIAFFLLVLY